MLASVFEEYVPKKLQSLYEVRLGLGLSQQELSNLTKSVGGHRVHRNTLSDCENGQSIKMLTATRIVTAINHVYRLRGRKAITVDDLTWEISDRKE